MLTEDISIEYFGGNVCIGSIALVDAQDTNDKLACLQEWRNARCWQIRREQALSLLLIWRALHLRNAK